MSGTFDEALDGLAAGPSESVAAGEAGSRGADGDASSHATVSALRARFGAAILHHEVVAGDEHVVYVAADRVYEVLGWLKEEPGQGYDLLQDLTAVDYGGGRPIQVVYQLRSIGNRQQIRVKAELPLDALEIASVAPLWQTADWLEREVFDLFGVRFSGHPDLRRILMPDNYAEGHPLRKDFPLRGRFSRAEQTRRALALEVEDVYTPEELAIGMRERSAPGGPDAGGGAAGEDARAAGRGEGGAQT